MFPSHDQLEYEYVKLASHSTSNVSSLNGLTVTGGTSGVVAEVTNTTEATSTAAATIYVTYTKTGTNNTAKTFTEGETISFTGGTAVVGTSGTSLPTASNATGRASAVKIEEGVYFINGFFVKNDEETLILDAYDNTPTYRVGFTVTESFVTPEDDSSLNDNAQGTSNVNAPGAHRFKIALTLAKKTLTATGIVTGKPTLYVGVLSYASSI